MFLIYVYVAVVNIYLPPDIIFYTGEISSKLITLIVGEVHLVSEITGEKIAAVSTTTPVDSSGSVSDRYCTLGEAEFFTRRSYSCAARVFSEVHCYELEFSNFWHTVVSHELVGAYFGHMKSAEFTALLTTSTKSLVGALQSNMKNPKLIKLMNTNRTVSGKEFCLLPMSPLSQIWSCIILSIIVYIAITVPYYIAFGGENNFILSGDIATNVLLIIDIYLNLSIFAVEIDGEIITSVAEFKKLYLKGDCMFHVLCAAAIPLVSFGVSGGNIEIYSLLRCILLIRIRGVSFKFQKVFLYLESQFDLRFSENLFRILRTVTLVWLV